MVSSGPISKGSEETEASRSLTNQLNDSETCDEQTHARTLHTNIICTHTLKLLPPLLYPLSTQNSIAAILSFSASNPQKLKRPHKITCPGYHRNVQASLYPSHPQISPLPKIPDQIHFSFVTNLALPILCLPM